MKAWFRTSTVTSRRTRLPKAVGSGGSDLDDVNLLQDDARTDSARQSQLSQENSVLLVSGRRQPSDL